MLMEYLESFCLTSRKRFFTFAVLFFVVLEPVLTVLMFLESNEGSTDEFVLSAVFSAFILIGLGGFFYYKMIYMPRKIFRGRVNYLQMQGWLNYALKDMQTGTLSFKDTVLLGKDCIIGKGLGVMLLYDEISLLYVTMDKYTIEGSVFQRRYLAAKVGSQTYKLCYLPSNTQFAREWNEMREYLKQAAPHIEVR